MAQSIKLGSDTYLDASGVTCTYDGKSLLQQSSWTPHLYDYNTKIMDLPSGTYYRIGNLVIAWVNVGHFTPTSAISTMLQIRNLPMSAAIGGSIYIAGYTNCAGDRTVQIATNFYPRPNITLAANTDYGTLSCCIIGIFR